MQLIHIDEINETYNFVILSNKTINFINEHYYLSARMMSNDDTISAMGYQILDTIDIKLKDLIDKIDKLKQNLNSKELVFKIFYDHLEESNIFAIKQGIVESIINRLNKSSYAFYPCKTFQEFLKYNELKFHITKDDLIRLINSDNSNTNDLLIEIYNKFKNKEYEYLDEFIHYAKQRKNKIIKRK